MENLFDKLEEPSPSATPLERLHYLIKLSRLNQAQFAKRLQMDPGALSRILSGKTAISRRFIDRLVLDLGISREWIMSGNDVPYPLSLIHI
ncbi:MAG: helix-turn-helix domain-containing protein, partial [Muribaculaceae bacterium]|nr:helix-turn-helix domain-containing protein [Muribaculaceae bacterium]